jgi:hypothetical protein
LPVGMGHWRVDRWLCVTASRQLCSLTYLLIVVGGCAIARQL